MILVDANLLIVARVSDLPRHAAARAWLEDRLNDATPVGLPWPSLLAFLRITTNPRVFRTPLTLDQAWKQVEEWLGLPSVWLPQPTERHAPLLAEQLRQTSGRPNTVPDAHLATLAIEHGLTLYTTDRDFARFA